MNTNKFNIKNKVVIITGGAGLFAKSHIDVVLENNAVAVILDKNIKKLKKIKKKNIS